MKAPFTYFGGKSKVAGEVWRRFGKVRNYLEPFAGSAAMLLKRPRSTVVNASHDHDWGIETINDADGLVSNFWRAMRHCPEELIYHANWPVNEADLHARHLWLVNQKEVLAEKLMGDPEWCDPKAAGWWLWGMCAWIGSGYCSGQGSWISLHGMLVSKGEIDAAGVVRKLPHIGNSGMGINRTIPHIGDSGFVGEDQVRHHLSPLINRLRLVRVACGDWKRILGAGADESMGSCAVFLDPPYSEGDIDYNSGDRSVTHDVRKWCIENFHRSHMKIALCGYDTEHEELEGVGWSAYRWSTNGGYLGGGGGDGEKNRHRETIWFSPSCDNEELQPGLF